MPPFTLDLTGVRGDGFLRDIPLTKRDPTDPTGQRTVPLAVGEAQALKDTYTVIRMQVRNPQDSTTILLDASSENGELFIKPDAAPGPVLSIRIPSTKTATVLSAPYDMQFDHEGSLGPLTWLRGKFKLTGDVTR
ncbi:hypothetical protein [Deinococcus apachensis]|uniref:hypothetical protein n=1 Tax=Deinococcus apachensis TaxID=309886 RepID=UPI000368AC2F|nr:hypothetical protein [Deinococcus apachensis]